MNDRLLNATEKKERIRHPQISRLLSKLLADEKPDEDAKQTHALVSAMLEDAIRENASDIHLDPVSGGYQLRFRIDGALVDTVLLEPEQGRYVLRSFKSHSGIEPGYALRPEDGRCEFQIGRRVVTVRVATMPTVLGEKLALRLLPPELGRLQLHELGFSDEDYSQVRRAIYDARGMILFSGPTGAGKTTTAYALLHEIKNSNQSIITIEDPVEYVIEGVTQVQVNHKQKLTYAEAIKGVMRLDPDVIMMGEIRDAASATAALDAASGGQAFISTLHARDAVGTITALRNFNLTDHEIAANLDLIAAQRLVRRLCSACRKQGPPT
jgi:type II secretory ATPase GspE/PulE/Tfp pilus assembly ATPase PilB-like protein